MYAVEGSEIWNLTQKWYSLWISAIILGVGGLIARVNFNQSEKPARTTVSKKSFILACTAAVAIFVFKMPNNGEVLSRLFFAAIAGIATSLLIKPSTRAPVVTPLSFSFVLCILSILLLVSGSLKMALIAASISTTAAACAILASVGGGFSGGASFSMAGISSCIALGLYGMSYHKNSDVSTVDWWIVALAPLLLCVANCFQYRRVMIFGFVAILLVCIPLVVASIQKS
ncbi:hypothetical protein LBMAG51_02760 [Phycisphaerae bacterium]|nr:hypothetical protein LBMAG51_02760 [Phycisphaerae bacterium]